MRSCHQLFMEFEIRASETLHIPLFGKDIQILQNQCKSDQILSRSDRYSLSYGFPFHHIADRLDAAGIALFATHVSVSLLRDSFQHAFALQTEQKFPNRSTFQIEFLCDFPFT